MDSQRVGTCASPTSTEAASRKASSTSRAPAEEVLDIALLKDAVLFSALFIVSRRSELALCKPCPWSGLSAACCSICTKRCTLMTVCV